MGSTTDPRGRPTSPFLLLLAAGLVAAVCSSAHGSGRGRGRESLGWGRRLVETDTAAEGEGHGPKEGEITNIFAIALTHLDQNEVGYMMVLVLVSELILDECLRRIESSAGSNARACLREVYKELSTLGVVSFTLFMVQSFCRLNEASVEAFEYSHILVFAFAICYIVQSGVLIASIKPIKRHLIRLSAFGDAVAAAAATATAASPTVPADPGGRQLGQRTMALFRCARGHGRHDDVGQHLHAVQAFAGFRVFRQRFLRKFALPPSFLYDRYLIVVYNQWVLFKLDIASWCWAFMVAIFGVHTLVSHYHRAAEFLLHPVTFLVYGWLTLAVDAGLFLLVHRKHAEVLARLRAQEQRGGLDHSAGCGGGDGDRGGMAISGAVVASCRAARIPRTASGSYDTLDLLKARRAALFAHYHSGGDVATVASTPASAKANNGGSHDAGILRHGPRRWLAPGAPPTLRAPPDADDEVTGGFELWEDRLFNYGTEALNIVRCLYLAAFLCAYAVPAFHWFPTGLAFLYVLAVPVPAILTGTVLIPRMVVRYLLVTSLQALDLEALDTVVEYMDETEVALREISQLIRRLTTTTTASGDPLAATVKDPWTVERLFASLAHDRPTISYAELRLFLQRHGVHLSPRHFRALVRFIDTDLCGNVHLHDFKMLLKADHVFCVAGAAHHPSFDRVYSRLLSTASQSGSASNAIADEGGLRWSHQMDGKVATLLRRGSGSLGMEKGAVAAAAGGSEAAVVAPGRDEAAV